MLLFIGPSRALGKWTGETPGRMVAPMSPQASFKALSLKSLATLAVGLVVLAYIFSPDRLLLFPSTDLLGSIGATRRFIPFDNGKLEIWTGRSPLCRPGTPPDGVLPALLRQRRPRRSERGHRGHGMGRDAHGRNLGRQLSRLRRQHRPGAARPHRPGGGGGVRRAAPGGGRASHRRFRHEHRHDRRAGSVAAQRPVAGVILQNPPPVRARSCCGSSGGGTCGCSRGPVAWRIPGALDSLANARAVRVRGCSCSREKDEIVAPRFQRWVVDAYAGEKRIVPGAGRVAQFAHRRPGAGSVLPRGGLAVVETIAALTRRPCHPPSRPIPSRPPRVGRWR